MYSRLHQTDDLVSNITSGLTSVLTNTISQANASLVVRSNVSPDITIDLSEMLKPTSTATVSSQNQTALNWIKPEVTINAFGFTRTSAPYGTPSGNAFIFFFIMLAISAILGSKLALMLCKSLEKR